MSHSRLVPLMLITALALAGCTQPGAAAPSPIRDLSPVPTLEPGDEVELHWQAPSDWGTGTGRCYSVEYYDGIEWRHLDTVLEPRYVHELPLETASLGNRFSVRAETSAGHSEWIVTNPFDIISPFPDSLEIAPGNQDLGAEQGEFILVVQGNGQGTVAWSADVTWLTLPTESDVAEEVVVTVQANDSGAPRQGVITASHGQLKATITVTQAGGEDSTRLEVVPRIVSVNTSGETSFALLGTVLPTQASAKVYWTSDVDWLTVPENSQSGKEIKIKVKENTGGSRTGKITALVGGCAPVTVSVTQVGRTAPQAPTGIVVPKTLFPGNYNLSWTAPKNWGSGINNHYRIEFFNGDSWVFVGTSFEAQYVFSVPDIILREAKFRVRAETNHGDSSYTESTPFSIGEISDEEDEGELCLLNPVFYYEEGRLVLTAMLHSSFQMRMSLNTLQIMVNNELGEVVRETFPLPLVLEPGQALEQRFEFTLAQAPSLEGLVAEICWYN